MVGISFGRPVGPYADTKELEYISALHQTCAPQLRQNGTIAARDIMYYLASRHGIRVDKDVVRQAIIHELCGSPLPSAVTDANARKLATVAESALEVPDKGNHVIGHNASPDFPEGENIDDDDDDNDDSTDNEEPDAVMDLCQMLGLLMIPFLRSGNSDGNNSETVERVLEIALGTIWTELRAHSVISGLTVESKKHGRKYGRKTSSKSGGGDGEEEGAWMTAEILREVFEIFGEFGVTKVLLQEMIDMATAAGAEMQEGGKFYLTKSSFLEIVTADVQLFNPNIDEIESTHFDDARKAFDDKQNSGTTRRGSTFAKSVRTSTSGGMLAAAAATATAAAASDGYSTEKCEKAEIDGIAATNHKGAYPFSTMYTAANIDNSADTYRSTMWFTLVWVSTIFVFLCYVSGSLVGLDGFDSCENAFGCKIGVSLANWSIIFLQLMILGFIWIMGANLGNSTSPTETLAAKLSTTARVLCAVALVAMTTIVPFFYEFDGYFFNTTKTKTYVAGYWIVLALGCIIIPIQLARLLGIFFPLGWIASGGMANKEQRTKKAATFKINRFVEHAALLHAAPEGLDGGESESLVFNPSSGHDLKRVPSGVSDTVRSVSKSLFASEINYRNSRNAGPGTSTSKVLLNYHHMQDTQEVTGGVSWTFNKIYDGTLFEEEGIYLHGRLLAVNAVQFLIVLFLIGGFVPLMTILGDTLSDNDDGCDIRLEGITISSNGTTKEPSSETVVVEEARYLQEISVDSISFQSSNVTYEPTFDNETKPIPPFNETEYWTGFWVNAREKFSWGTYEPTEEGYQNIYNVNETHWSDGETIYEGQFPLFNGTHYNVDGFEAPAVCFDYYITNGTELVYNDLAGANSFLELADVQPWQYQFSAGMGLLFAIIATVCIAMVYIPSFVSSVIKLRSGYSPSLKGDQITFLMFRKSPDQTAIIWGSAFWGVVFSALGAFFFFSLIFFVMVWTMTQSYVANLVAGYIGVFTTIGVKVLVMQLLRKFFYAGGYYRRRPAASNMMNVVLECWSLGLSVGTVTARAVKLLIVTFFYIGRIDTPMLAPGVGQLGPLPMDPAPNAFRKDLLVHEAHRHPFLERLGLIYMTKLHNGKNFGTRAGAHWRLLVVLALTPWMRNYRVSRCSDLMMILEADVDVTDDDEEEEDEHDEGSKLMMDKTVRFQDPIFDKADSVQKLVAKRRALKRDLKVLNRLLSEKVTEADQMGDLSKRVKKSLMEDSTWGANRTRFLMEDVSMFSA